MISLVRQRHVDRYGCRRRTTRFHFLSDVMTRLPVPSTATLNEKECLRRHIICAFNAGQVSRSEASVTLGISEILTFNQPTPYAQCRQRGRAS